MTDCSPAHIPVSFKRDGSVIRSNVPKKQRSSTEREIHIFSANHWVTETDHRTPPNFQLHQSPDNTLTSIFNQIKDRLGDSQLVRSVIFISDFKLNFNLPVEKVLEQISRMVHYIESRGHVVTFSFLPFVPAYRKDPDVNTEYFPTPDRSPYIISLNNLFKDLGSRNPLGSCFSNRRVGLSATRKQVKPQDWLGYDSAAACWATIPLSCLAT